MAEKLLLINPSRRKRRPTKRRRVARKTVAARAPVKRRARRRVLVANPARRTRRRSSRKSMATRVSPKNLMGGIIMPAITSASGALLLDIVWNQLPVPLALKTGPLRHVAKGAGAVALGMLAGNFIKKSTANQLVAGAMTVIVHEALKEQVAKFVPQLGLAYLNPGMSVDGMGYYVDQNALPQAPMSSERNNDSLSMYVDYA